jgi:hypothetical protein
MRCESTATAAGENVSRVSKDEQGVVGALRDAAKGDMRRKTHSALRLIPCRPGSAGTYQ